MGCYLWMCEKAQMTSFSWLLCVNIWRRRTFPRLFHFQHYWCNVKCGVNVETYSSIICDDGQNQSGFELPAEWQYMYWKYCYEISGEIREVISYATLHLSHITMAHASTRFWWTSSKLPKYHCPFKNSWKTAPEEVLVPVTW